MRSAQRPPTYICIPHYDVYSYIGRSFPRAATERDAEAVAASDDDE